MSPGVLALLIPIVAVLTGGAIAVTAILTKHQRHMAEMMRRDREEAQAGLVSAEVDDMRRELQDLRDRVNQQAIEQDDVPPRLHQKN